MKRVLTQLKDSLRLPIFPLLVVAALSISTTAVADDILFVSDSETDAENIPDALSGYNVTVIRNDYEVTGGTFGAAEGTNPTLKGDLSGYCAVYWSASGPHEPLGFTPQRIDNGSFEDVAMTHIPGASNYMEVLANETFVTGWTIDQKVAWGINVTDGFDASEGDGFVDLSSFGDTSAGEINQDLATMNGVEYLFSIDRQGDGSIVSINGTDIALTAGAMNGSWTTYTATYTATGDITTLEIRKDPTDTTGVVFIDNLSFVPNSPAPLGLGADGGLHTDAAVFTNLMGYVDNGGFVFVTGHDAIAHPFDPLLVEFVGGAGASSGQQLNPGYNPIVNVATPLTVGLTIAGVPAPNGGVNPVDNVQEQDYLTMVAGDVTMLVIDGSVGIAQAVGWSVRHPNGASDDFDNGHIAYVANGVFFYETEQEDMDGNPVTETLSDGQDPSWTQMGSSYRKALLNFAQNAACTEAVPVLDDVYGRGKGTKVNLTWTANGADSYDVFRSDDSGGPYDLRGNTTGNVFVDSPVVAGETYYYVVQGVFGGENSADSNEAEVIVPAGRGR